MMTIRASAPTSTRPFARPWWLAPLVVVLGLVATGCDTDVGGVGGASEKPRTLIVSEAWGRDHQAGSGGGSAAGGVEAQSRLASLQKALDTLRQETGTGWVGRQDDVTGFLSELTGGAWPGTPPSFQGAHRPAPFRNDAFVAGGG